MAKIIAEKYMGIDPVDQLPKWMRVWGFFVNGDEETVKVYYREVLIGPAGNVVKVLKDTEYTRKNVYEQPPGPFYPDGLTERLKYDDLAADEAGLRIKAMIENDLVEYDGTPESLKQL